MNFNIHDSELGKKASTPERYDASLLFRIPRSENRLKYALEDHALPFTGLDVWNCYEVSFLADNGFPVSGVLKISYPASSTYIVESKSLKLYLNSFNMEYMGADIQIACKNFTNIVLRDLHLLLRTDVQVHLFCNRGLMEVPFQELDYKPLISFVSKEQLYSCKFEHFYETPALLSGDKTSYINTYAFSTDLLRSNCRVTNQPDWGDLFVKIETEFEIDFLSVISYLISFRKENHFHEEVVEMIYKRFLDKYQPTKLMVAAMYTRRGGIDINPLRTNFSDWIPVAFSDCSLPLEKTLRQ